MKTFPILLLGVAMVCTSSGALAERADPLPAEPAARAFAWPGGARAAVSLAYDDALDSQLDKALPALDRAGLKGSFYLQLSNPAVDRRLGEWRAAARRGHELGNHTLFHQCSGSQPDRQWLAPHRDLDKLSVEQLREEVLLANAMLHAIDGKRARTFSAPCGDLAAGGRPYLPEVAASFVAIMAGSANGAPPSMQEIDPYAVRVFTPVGLTGQQLIGMVQDAGARGSMINFTFHGIGGDYLQVSEQAHRELLAFLAANRKLYWTDTFLNIMKHVKEQQRP